MRDTNITDNTTVFILLRLRYFSTPAKIYKPLIFNALNNQD